jgi:hypothetical protein
MLYTAACKNRLLEKNSSAALLFFSFFLGAVFVLGKTVQKLWVGLHVFGLL